MNTQQPADGEGRGDDTPIRATDVPERTGNLGPTVGTGSTLGLGCVIAIAVLVLIAFLARRFLGVW